MLRSVGNRRGQAQVVAGSKQVPCPECGPRRSPNRNQQVCVQVTYADAEQGMVADEKKNLVIAGDRGLWQILQRPARRLTPETLSSLLKDAMRRRAAQTLLAGAARGTLAEGAQLTMQEIQSEVNAVRRARRGAPR